MRYFIFLFFWALLVMVATMSFAPNNTELNYQPLYFKSLDQLQSVQEKLLATVKESNLRDSADVIRIHSEITAARKELKKVDFWIRYFEPIVYRQLNGPLPVEWETEVFEKFEKPYRRKGAGLTLAAVYLDEEKPEMDSLVHLLENALRTHDTFRADSITTQLDSYHHFFLCNRLFLLNLAAIYTTGFECPDADQIVTELKIMMAAVKEIYLAYNANFQQTSLQQPYLFLFDAALQFVNQSSESYDDFDHFSFIRNFVNPLFSLNQQYITNYKVRSRSFVDYSLNNSNQSLFSKGLYFGQNTKGIFLRVNDTVVLREIDSIGKLLFYDPILSGNNARSCASCHKPTEYFTDTVSTSSLQFDKEKSLARNAPSLINAIYNHLIMVDGSHISLQDQTKGVITNKMEMGGSTTEIVDKVITCNEYKNVFQKLLKYTPLYEEISLEHITSAITLYYGKFSNQYAPFDRAMNHQDELSADARTGFNLFMGKAQCATCHFVPQFNGVKPPYVGSEFEVLGVPEDTSFSELSNDSGRFSVNPAPETLHAFRTGSLRNIEFTAPYMHNGVFRTLQEVVDFYDAGGGAGRGLKINNQTLSSDSLHLTPQEKNQLITFLKSLNEEIHFEKPPMRLPRSSKTQLNQRKIGGTY